MKLLHSWFMRVGYFMQAGYFMRAGHYMQAGYFMRAGCSLRVSDFVQKYKNKSEFGAEMLSSSCRKPRIVSLEINSSQDKSHNLSTSLSKLENSSNFTEPKIKTSKTKLSTNRRRWLIELD
jgi:hypothetical protein